MNATRKKFRWFGLLPIVAGAYVLIYLAVTEEHVSFWIFPTGIVALFMIYRGGLFFYRRSRA